MIKKKSPNKKLAKKLKTKPGLANDLDLLKEKIMGTSWHHLQTESTIKQFFCELIDVIKKQI